MAKKPKAKSEAERADDIVLSRLENILLSRPSLFFNEIKGNAVKVDAIIDLLEMYRNDLFYLGLKNLSRRGVHIPAHKGSDDDHHTAFWDFRDTFRSRDFRLIYSFETKAFTAWGAQMDAKLPIAIGTVKISEEMLADLKSMVTAPDMRKIQLMQDNWDLRTGVQVPKP